MKEHIQALLDADVNGTTDLLLEEWKKLIWKLQINGQLLNFDGKFDHINREDDTLIGPTLTVEPFFIPEPLKFVAWCTVIQGECLMSDVLGNKIRVRIDGQMLTFTAPLEMFITIL